MTYNLLTSQNSLAASIASDSEDVNANEYFRIAFSGKTATGKTEYVEAINCSDLYAEQIAAEEKLFVAQFGAAALKDWICPNVAEIELDASRDIEFEMTVTTCAEAASINSANGWQSYDPSTECKTSEESLLELGSSSATTHTVSTKLLGSIFDPAWFED